MDDVYTAKCKVIAPPDWGPAVPPYAVAPFVELVLPCTPRAVVCMGEEYYMVPQELALSLLKAASGEGNLAYYWWARKDYPSPHQAFYFPKAVCELV